MKRTAKTLATCLLVSLLVQTHSYGNEGWTRRDEFFLYSETSAHSQKKVAVQESKLQYTAFSHAPHLDFYIGTNLNQTYEWKRESLASGNHVAFYPGVRLRVPRLPLTLHAEFWQLFLTHPSAGANSSPNDLRLGAVGYSWSDLKVLSPRLRLFSETYGDLIFSERLNQDLFLQVWTKLGSRIEVGKAFHFDPYLEGILKRSRLGLPGDHVEDFRTGGRIARQFGRVGAAALGSYGWNQEEWTGLVAISGGF